MYTPPTVAREQPRRRPDRASRPLLPGALLLAFRGLAATALPRAHVAVTNCRRLPGSSHRSLYHGHTNEFNPGRNDTWQPRINEIRQTIVPAEICGAAGDVVYWHGRTAHSPGIHTGPGVRLAVPHDLQKALSRSAGPPTGPPPEWFKDVPVR